MRRPGCLAALLSVVMTFALVAGAPIAGAAPDPAPQPVVLEPRAFVLVDAGSGKVLAGNEIDTSLHPASTAKVMTALTATERLAPDADVTVDAVAAAVEANKVGFAVGTTWTFEQMMAVMMMESANDAAYAIAIAASGSLEGFEAAMADTAKRIGLTHSVLNDPAGLDTYASYKAGPYMSALDLAIVTRNALAVPAIAKWAALRDYAFTDPNGVHRTLLNHNKMLPGASYQYLGSTGFKTGFTNRAQHTLVATATRDGRTLIAVILGAPDSGYLKAAQLLDSGFAMPADAPAFNNITLPPVAVTTYAERASGQEAFALLGSAPAVTGTANLPPASIQPLSQAPRAAAPVPTVVVAEASSGPLSLRNVVIVLLLIGATTFFLRRRAVKRQRARRMAARKRRMAAIRSGGLPVVDGRYRPGLRMGPPVESHVHVRRADHT